MRSAPSIVALALTSVSVLLLELVQVRVFAYSLHPLLAYAAVSIAMLGFGLGATALTLRPSLASGPRASSKLAVASWSFGVSILLSNVLFARFSARIVSLTGGVHVDPGWIAVAVLPSVVPYALAGLIVAALLQSDAARVGRLYFWNLLGSAVGCVALVPLLRPLGAERLVAVSIALAMVVPPLLLWWPREGSSIEIQDKTRGSVVRWVSAVSAVIALVVTPLAPSVFSFQPDSSDLLYVQAAAHHEHLVREASVWDPVGRIDIIRHPKPFVFVPEPVHYRTLTNDSGAMALLLEPPREAPSWGRDIFEQTVYGAPYHVIGPHPDVLVVGVGGGMDIHAAVHWHARHVVGVEVCGATLSLLRGPYRDYTRTWWERPGQVSLVQADGRSFAHRTSERFDLVQLSGVDTFTMRTGSAMVTAEDFLYTEEAFVDFLRLLKPGGVLAVTRFGDEAMNLATLASVALRKLGVARPDKQIAAIQAGFASGVIVSRRPFSPAQLRSVRHLEDRTEPTRVRIPHYDAAGLRASDPIVLLHPTGRHPAPRYERFFEGMTRGQELASLRQVGNPFRPSTDDRPYYMLGQLFGQTGHVSPVIRALQLVSLFIALLSLLLIALPAWSKRKVTSFSFKRAVPSLAFFSLIGMSFMLLEVGLMHRSVVFVGSPGMSVSVVLASLLTSVGVGAWVTDRLDWTPRKKLVVAGASLLLTAGVYAVGWRAAQDALFGLPDWARSATAGLALAPVGFWMGWYFPSGLRQVTDRVRGLEPWAIAANGFASVLGSLVTLFVAVSYGFHTVFVLALVGYAAAVVISEGVGHHHITY